MIEAHQKAAYDVGELCTFIRRLAQAHTRMTWRRLHGRLPFSTALPPTFVAWAADSPPLNNLHAASLPLGARADRFIMWQQTLSTEG